jgi:multidrug efflux system membrane fusion protein
MPELQSYTQLLKAKLPHITRTKLVGWILLILGLIAAAVWFLYPSPTAQGQGQGRHGRGDASAVTPVTVAEARKGDIDITHRALGTVTPLANVTVRTQINGQLMEVNFQEGQIVHQGDYLAQIDPRPYQNALEQANGALHRDEALLKDAQLNLERYRKLVAEDSISKQQADTQASLVQQDEGNILTDKSQIDSAQLNLTYAHITAPITGRVGLRQVDPGNYVQTSDANGIVTMTQLQPITVIFTLPEDDVPTVMKLYNDGAELTAAAYDRTQSVKLATGRLVATDNQIDPTTGTVKLRAQFDNQDNALFPNQFVNIELKISTQHDATLAPTASILRGTSGTFVYRLKDDTTVAVQPVKLGATQGDVVEITDGLAPGDKVVTEGTDKLRDGAHVAVK